MRYKSLVCLLLIFCEQSSLTNINAQEKYQLKAYTSDNGLSHNFIQSIARDQTGFLWIATWDGLSRFDGYEFRNYYHNPKDSTSFPFFVIDRVLVDRLNNVWLYTQGLPAVLYDRAKDSFFPFSSGPIRDFRPRDILNDHNNNVWLNIDSTIYNFNPGTKLFQSLNRSLMFMAFNLPSIILGPSGLLFWSIMLILFLKGQSSQTRQSCLVKQEDYPLIHINHLQFIMHSEFLIFM
jgi:ligand-binding sensor domain-containing protein